MALLQLILIVIHQWSLGYTSEIRPHPVIVGGSPIAIEKAPFMAIYCEANDRENVCGAVIITERFVLSAAHCHCSFDRQSCNKVVIVGTDKRAKGGQIFKIKKSIIHPSYSSSSDNDVVILKLRHRLQFSEKVQPIRMADAGLLIKPRASLEVFGFGVEYWGALEESICLRTVSIPYIRTAKCRRMYSKVGIEVTENMICAGEKERDSCQGDSGGPLVYNNTLVGLVSSGNKCGVYPGLYTRVSNVREFIDAVIKKY